MQACPVAILSRLQIDQITLNTLIFVSLMIPVSTAILSDPFSWSHQLAVSMMYARKLLACILQKKLLACS